MRVLMTPLFLILIFTLAALGQRERSPFFFLLDTSVPSSGIAGGGVAGSAHDPTLALINPAHISNGVEDFTLSLQSYPGSQLPGTFPLSEDPSYYYTSIQIAKQYSTSATSRHFRLGAAFGYSSLNSGKIPAFNTAGQIVGSFQPIEKMPVYSISAGTRFFADIDFGLNYKRYSVDYSYQNSPRQDIEATADALDFGFIISMPILGNRNNAFDFGDPVDESQRTDHTLNFTLGYSQRNIGSDIEYSTNFDNDPFPRLANLGIGLHYHLIRSWGNEQIKILSLSILGEAEDALLKNPQATENFEFYAALADINIFKHVLVFQFDDDVTHKRSFELGVFETIHLSSGVRAGERRETLSSLGIGVSTGGLHKWFTRGGRNKLRIMNRAFNLQYHFADFGFTEDDALSMHSLTVTIGN